MSLLKLENVTKRFGGLVAVNQVSLDINEGEVIALVGPSGGGKSTIANLLARFWGQYQGEIKLGANGLQLTQINQNEMRDSISFIPQNPYIFNTSVSSNIAIGNPSASQEEIIQAAASAQIHKKILGLRDGYQTVLSERGLDLSAGERQRLAIARAVLKDAPLFVLDEPTANLDPITEQEILQTIYEILEGKTALMITHRLVGLNRADRILVMHMGRIIENGTEADLLAQKGFYHRMWSLQNRLLNY